MLLANDIETTPAWVFLVILALIILGFLVKVGIHVYREIRDDDKDRHIRGWGR
jgi:hypothetical protein